MITVDGFETPEIYPLFLNRYYELLILMILNLLLAAFVNYVILTRSKTLGSFKYYLLNQFFWAQLHEYQFMLTCPVYLSPYMSGFMGGFFRPYGTSEATTIFAILGICFRAGTCTGVFMSLANRFIFTFHENLKRYIHNKTTFIVVILMHVTSYTVCSTVLLYLMHDNATIRLIAANETHGALNKYFNESSLMYIPELEGFPRKSVKTLLSHSLEPF
uniref:Sodium/hydrogen exchanger n=1 Tax=Panagrellus redivivus TaxID=6233 RepID=A0A7E4USR7_PANRE